MSEKILLQILDELKSVKQSQHNMQKDIQSMQENIQSMQNDIQSIKDDMLIMQDDIHMLKDTTARIESKQDVIYEQTAKLSEYHTEIKTEIETLKDRLDFNTYKITETERELFILKRKN